MGVSYWVDNEKEISTNVLVVFSINIKRKIVHAVVIATVIMNDKKLLTISIERENNKLFACDVVIPKIVVYCIYIVLHELL